MISVERNQHMSNSTKFCLYCGKALPRDALFCLECGKQQSPSTPEAVDRSEQSVPYVQPPYRAQSPARKRQKPRAFSVIKAFLLLFISIALIVTAFLPVLSVNIEYDKDNVFSTKLSAIDTFELFIDSFDEIPEKDLEREYESIEKTAEELAIQTPQELSSKGALSEKTKEKYANLMMLTVSTDYRLQGASAPVIMWTAMILIALYMLVCVALFVFSLVYLILSFASPRNCEKAYRGAVMMLAAAPILVTAFYFALSASFSPVFLTSGAKSLTFSLGIILPFAISAGAVLCFIICNLIHSLVSKEKENKPKTFPRILAALASVLVIVSLFMPVMLSSARTVFAEKADGEKSTVTFSHNPDFFTNFHPSKVLHEHYERFSKAKDERDATLDEQFAQFEAYTTEQVEDGLADNVNNAYIMHISASFGSYQYWWLFALLPVIYVLIMLSFGIILWLNLSCLAGGKYSPATSIVFKILGLLFAFVAVGMIATFVVCEKAYINELGLESRYAFGIHFGSIAMGVLALINVFIPSRRFLKVCADEIPEELPLPVEEPTAEDPASAPKTEPEPEVKPEPEPEIKTETESTTAAEETPVEEAKEEPVAPPVVEEAKKVSIVPPIVEETKKVSVVPPVVEETKKVSVVPPVVDETEEEPVEISEETHSEEPALTATPVSDTLPEAEAPQTEETISDDVPEAVAEVVPEAAPEVAPEVVAEAAPEVAPEVVAEAATEVAPEVVAEAAPEVAPEVVAEAATEKPKFCPQCGAKYTGTPMFCNTCGNKLRK